MQVVVLSPWEEHVCRGEATLSVSLIIPCMFRVLISRVQLSEVYCNITNFAQLGVQTDIF